MLSVLPRLPVAHIRTRSLANARTAIDTRPPAWIGAVNEWCEVGGITLSSSGVLQSGADTGVFAYSSGIINTVGVYVGTAFLTGTFLCLWGGGHADYSGNEVYAFGPLEATTPQWYRLRDRTDPAPSNVSEDGSGNPVSRHTYGNIHFLPDTNEMIAPGGLFRYIDSSGVSVAHVFDFNQSDPNTTTPWETRGSGLSGPRYTGYEPSSGRIWYKPTGSIVGYFDLATSTQTEASFKSPVASGDGKGVVDTNRGIWFVMTGATLQAYRTNNGTGNDYYAPTTTGTAPTGTCTIEYDPVDDVLRVWNDNGKQLWTLTPPGTDPYEGGNAWTWSSQTPSGGATPGAANGTGTFNRFGFVNSSKGGFRGYLLYNAPSQPVYFFRTA